MTNKSTWSVHVAVSPPNGWNNRASVDLVQLEQPDERASTLSSWNIRASERRPCPAGTALQASTLSSWNSRARVDLVQLEHPGERRPCPAGTAGQESVYLVQLEQPDESRPCPAGTAERASTMSIWNSRAGVDLVQLEQPGERRPCPAGSCRRSLLSPARTAGTATTSVRVDLAPSLFSGRRSAPRVR